MKRLGLLGKFAILSGICMGLLGVAVSWLEGEIIRGRALQSATDSAELVAHVALQAQLTPAGMAGGLSAAQIRALNHTFAEGLAEGRIARIKVWSPTGVVMYSDDNSLIGRRFPVESDLEEALDGEESSDISSLEEAENVAERQFGRLLEVYLPLRFRPSGPPAGAFELYVPYRPIAAVIAHDTRRLYLLTVVGLLLLYGALFRIVFRASRRIVRQAAELSSRAEESARAAATDQVTGLPNRAGFVSAITELLESGTEDLSVVMMDLDRFREVNDTLGHDAGDLLLKEIGQRLTSADLEAAGIARLGADAFGLVVPGSAERATAVAGDLSRLFERPIRVGGLPIQVIPNVGIATRRAGEDAGSLVRQADIAMHAAKAHPSRVQSYSERIDHYTPGRLAMAGELREGIAAGQLVLHLQPKIDLARGIVVGAEALVRWDHPTRGLVPPDSFIPLAEGAGMIRPLTAWVLAEALSVSKELQQAGSSLSMAVNLSARSLLDPHLHDDVCAALGTAGVEPDGLILEITETSMVQDGPSAMRSLTALTELGVTLSIDDFGTGYSSLSYLQRLPVSELKIDRSFVTDMDSNDGNLAIVRAAVDVGRALGLVVLAEGIESAQVADLLKDIGCHLGQGYHFGRPMPRADFSAWVSGNGSTEVSGRKPHATPRDTRPRRRRARDRNQKSDLLLGSD